MPRNPLLTAALFSAASALIGAGAPASAAIISADPADCIYSLPRTNGETYDAGVSGTAGIVLQNGVTTDTTLQVGATSGNTAIATSIIPFQLPTLSAGETFASASFSIGQSSVSNAQQIDLYGLGRRAAATVQPSDYYRGTTGGDTTDATLVQSAFVATTDTFAVNAITSTSATGNANLLSYLNTQYAGGAGAGQYVFLRLNVTEAFITTNTRLNPAAQEHATAGLRPVLNYTVVPEPGSAGAMAVVAAAGLLRRRRQG